jgi:hypothetical protein
MEKLRASKVQYWPLLAYGWGRKSSRQAEVGEALLEGGDKGLADLGGLVVGLEVVALLGGGVTADGADVDHAVAELDKGAALDRDVEVGDVVEAEVGELLVLVLADPADEAVGGKGLPQLEGRQAVLGEAEVEEGRNGNAGGLAELLFLLLQVGAADEANGALLTELLEDVESLDRGALQMCRTSVIVACHHFLCASLASMALRRGERGQQ